MTLTRATLGSFRTAHAAWLFGLFAFFLPTATWNPVSRFDLTRAVVEHRAVTIDPYVTSTGDRAFAQEHWYTDKAPIPSLVAVPVYALIALAQRARGASVSYDAYGTTLHPAVRLVPNHAFQQALYGCSLATSGVAGVAIGLLLFELLRRRTNSVTAFLASTLVVLGTPLFPYSTSFYSHVPSAALLLGAVVLLDGRGKRPLDAPPSPASVRGAGLCLTLATGCEYLVAAPVALIGLSFLLWSQPTDRWRHLRNLAVGGALPAIVIGGYHAAAFGAPWRTGYSFITNPEFASGQASGLFGIRLPTFAGTWGLTVGTRRGLFYIAPIAVLGVVFGIAHVKRRRDWAFGVGLATFALLVWLNAGYYMWWGGAAAGPRHLIPALPFLAAGVMLGLRAPQLWVRGMTLLAGVISVAHFTAITAVGIEAPERGELLYHYAWSRLLAGKLATFQGGSNLGLKLGLKGAASLLPLVLWGIGGAAYLFRQLQASSRRLAPDNVKKPRPARAPSASSR